MRKQGWYKILPLVLFLIGLPAVGVARDIAPIVSTEWLQANLSMPGLVIVDVRKVEQYREGHVPGAVNAFYRAWAFKRGDLYTEIPEEDDLFDLVGSMGLSPDSRVVVYGGTDTLQECFHTTRVACTMKYAGLGNVAILDGGFTKWVQEKRAVSQTVTRATPKVYRGVVRKDMFVDKGYVMKQYKRLVLLDVREPDYFSGKRKLDCIDHPGRLPGAINLPTSWAFTPERTFKSKEQLTVLAEAAVGTDRSKEIITYCDTGQCCPTWALILREILGYPNVRLYDGAMQEWTHDPSAPVE
jgi:thiosulfate/3-mercaptopyruvate sulfurtransferase